jgi:hypothetical protein
MGISLAAPWTSQRLSVPSESWRKEIRFTVSNTKVNGNFLSENVAWNADVQQLIMMLTLQTGTSAFCNQNADLLFGYRFDIDAWGDQFSFANEHVIRFLICFANGQCGPWSMAMDAPFSHKWTVLTTCSLQARCSKWRTGTVPSCDISASQVSRCPKDCSTVLRATYVLRSVL